MQKEQGRKEKAPGAQPEAKSQTKKPQHNGEAAQKQEAPFANVQHYLAPLCAQKRWVVWRLEKVKGKLTKVPYQGHNPKRKAATNDLATWCDYSTAVATVSQGGFSGIGYCLKDNETAAIDCDDCRNKETGALDPYVQELVTRCNSYTEITPSEEGLRIIGIGLGEKVHNKFQVGNGVQIEPYRKATRYITITGNLLPTGPTQLNNIDEHIDALVADFDKKQDDEQPHAQPETPTTCFGGLLRVAVRAPNTPATVRVASSMLPAKCCGGVTLQTGSSLRCWTATTASVNTAMTKPTQNVRRAAR
jgi:hypothetical protein